MFVQVAAERGRIVVRLVIVGAARTASAADLQQRAARGGGPRLRGRGASPAQVRPRAQPGRPSARTSSLQLLPRAHALPQR